MSSQICKVFIINNLLEYVRSGEWDGPLDEWETYIRNTKNWKRISRWKYTSNTHSICTGQGDCHKDYECNLEFTENNNSLIGSTMRVFLLKEAGSSGHFAVAERDGIVIAWGDFSD